MSWLLVEVRKLKWLFALLLVLLTAEALANLGTVALQKRLIDDVIMQGHYAELPTVIGLFAVVYLAYVALFTASPYVMYKNEAMLITALQKRMLSVLQHIPFGVFRQQQTTKYVQHFTSDIENVADTLSLFVPRGLQQIITAVILTVLVGEESPILLLVVLVMSVIYYFVSRYLGPKGKTISHEVQKRKGELLVHVEEGIASTREVVAYHRRAWEMGIYNRLFETYLAMVVKEGKFQNLLNFIGEPLKWCVYLTVLGFGAYGVMQGKTTLGTFVILYQFASRLVESYQGSFDFLMNLYSRKAYFERVKAILELDMQTQGEQQVEGKIERFALEGVSFAYQADTPLVLRDLSLDFPIGRKVAIVGASGSGKSTVAQLLVRLYDPMEGKVRINGRSLQDYQKGDWLKRLSLVPQEPYFFPESIRTNLLLGRENISEEQLRTACEIAQIQELIDELPEGLDTIIGERGISLSGGQRQRLAIARAILPEPDILLLDEGTSALDVETERLVQKALDEHRRGRTTIFIAHRLSTIENADLIYVMDHGSVVEAGTHAELMQGETKYRELFTAQVISA